MPREHAAHGQARQVCRRYGVLRLSTLCAAAVLAAAAPAVSQEAGVGDGWYTTPQAVRGEQLFSQHCLVCHGSAAALESVKWPVGYKVGSRPPSRLGDGLRRLNRQKYPSVYYLFGRIRDSMPAWGADTVSVQEKADIVAYLLKVNGYPAGPRELPPDMSRMEPMWLTEPGFTPLFNGVDFSGWKFNIGPNCRPAPVGCGKTGPGTTFRVEHGELATDGKIDGYAYTEKKYRDFTLRLQFKWVPPPDWRGEQDGVSFSGDSGIYVFVNDHLVYPKGLQFQLMVDTVMQPLLLDMKGKATYDQPAVARGVLRPLGRWNDVEIVSKNGVVTGAVNGVVLTTVRDHEFTESGGHIAVQSEGAATNFRNIRIKAE